MKILKTIYDFIVKVFVPFAQMDFIPKWKLIWSWEISKWVKVGATVGLILDGLWILWASKKLKK